MRKYFYVLFQRVFTKAYFGPGAPFCRRRLTALVWIFVLGMLMPAHPVMAALIPVTQAAYVSGNCAGVAISGNYAYVAAGSAGLKIYDVSNPSAPVLTGACDTPGSAMSLAVSGNYAYVADGDKDLCIINISDPAGPTITASTNDWFGTCFKIAHSGNYVHLLNYNNNAARIYNVANPSVPAVTCNYSGDFTKRGVALRGNYAYLAGYDRLAIYNISNPSAPVMTGSASPSGDFNGVALNGDFAYIAEGDDMEHVGSLRIYNIRNPAAPVAVNYIDIADVALDVDMCGEYAFVAASSKGLHIYDISSPDMIFKAGGFDTAGTAQDVAVSGEYAYVADGGGLGIYHFVLPATPTPTVTSSPTCTPTPAGAVPGNALQVLVYPQPADQEVHFRLGTGRDAEAKIVILNTAGKAVARITGRISPSQPVLTWSTSQAGQGVYFYLVYLDNKLEAKGKVYIGR